MGRPELRGPFETRSGIHGLFLFPAYIVLKHGTIMDQHIQLPIPLPLWQQLQVLINEGWAPDAQHILIEALRRYLDTHQAQLTETFMREDMQWGLYGKD